MSPTEERDIEIKRRVELEQKVRELEQTIKFYQAINSKPATQIELEKIIEQQRKQIKELQAQNCVLVEALQHYTKVNWKDSGRIYPCYEGEDPWTIAEAALNSPSTHHHLTLLAAKEGVIEKLDAWMETKPESLQYPGPDDEKPLMELKQSLSTLHDLQGGSREKV